MFKEHIKHEMGIKKDYIPNVRNGLNYKDRLRLRKRGAHLKLGNKHLDRKVLKCYPRGKAWLRIVDLHTCYWANNT